MKLYFEVKEFQSELKYDRIQLNLILFLCL